MWHPFSSRSRSLARRPRTPRSRGRSLERLEERQLLSYTDFELSSLLPANGGDGSKGFVTTGVVDRGRLGGPAQGYQPVGDVNQDGIEDFFLTAVGTTAAPGAVGRAY